MRKPALIRALYAELRQMLGSEVADGDVLKLAHHFVRAYGDAPYQLSEFGVAHDSRPFSSLPVDEAMADGGWRVLYHERRVTSWIDLREKSLELAKLAPVLDRYLGSAWQQYDWISEMASSTASSGTVFGSQRASARRKYL